MRGLALRRRPKPRARTRKKNRRVVFPQAQHRVKAQGNSDGIKISSSRPHGLGWSAETTVCDWGCSCWEEVAPVLEEVT